MDLIVALEPLQVTSIINRIRVMQPKAHVAWVLDPNSRSTSTAVFGLTVNHVYQDVTMLVNSGDIKYNTMIAIDT